MGLAESLLLSLAIALAVVYMATPYVIALADRLQFYDLPAGYKGHARPTPYLGGAAVMAGFVIALMLAASDWGRTLPLVGGAALLWTVGTVDDRRTVSPGLRAAVEVGLGGLVWASGLGWHLQMGWAPDLALTCVWILGVVNAFNLFDNMDGAATTMALVVSAGAATLGVIRHDTWLAVAATALGGACLGFLPRNLSRPARIFLGDGGSMPLGFAVAVLAMAAATASPAPWQSVVVGLLLVGIPALDTCLVVVSRRRRGVSVLTGGRDHLTHRIRRFLPGTRSVALSLGALQAGTCALAVLASQGGASFVVFSGILYLTVAGCAIGVLDNRPAEEFVIAGGDVAREAGGGDAGTWAVRGGLLLIGLGAGLSPFFSGFYSSTTWVPIGLGAVVLAVVAVVARPSDIRGPAAVACGALLGLGMWSLISATWAQSVESAVVDGNRLLVYGALFVLLLALLRGERRSVWLLGALAAGVVCVALSVLVRMLGADPGSLFLLGRLNEPLGYINGEGCLFVMGFWLCWAAAEQHRPALAGAGAAGATLMACMALLSQSRGTALAMAASIVVVAVVVRGRRRRLFGLLLVAVGFAVARGPLLAIYQQGATGGLTVAVAHTAARAAAVAALGVGVVWAVAVAALQHCRRTDPARAARIERVGSAALGLLAVAAVIVAAAAAGRIGHAASTQWHAFTHLSDPAGSTIAASSAGQSRLLSGAGNRYDYWRIATNVWRSNPIVGAGAGNYGQPYFAQRSTTEDILQPHSIELQTLAELGLIGLALLALFVAGVVGGVRRARRDAMSGAGGGILVAALGTSTAWFTQTSVDWMHLLPGITAAALGTMAVLVSGPQIRAAIPAPRATGGRLQRARRRTPAALGVAGVAVALVMAGASLSRQGLADRYRAQAQNEVAADPSAALAAANRSLGFDADAVSTYYVKAAALARFNQAAAADATLHTALAREPDNFVTWTLLGDVAVREGDLRTAQADYAHAHSLNPRDPSLLALAADPRAAAR